MGTKQSLPQVSEPLPTVEDWGQPPAVVPENERDATELVLQSWATCKAKPSPARYYRSEGEENERRASVLWRKRTSFIELDCGEDSFFVSNTYKVLGIADGVGGWAESGVDSSVFSNGLMENAKLYCETHRSELDPEVIMNNAFDKLVRDKRVTSGSSTVCIAALRNEGAKHFLDVANLGDSGLLIVRNNAVHHRVHEKVHSFNAPFQLAILPPAFQGRAFSDKVSDCLRESVEVKSGDVVIMGTDGLFDNRFNSQLAADAGAMGDNQETILGVPVSGVFLLPFLSGKNLERNDPFRIAQRILSETTKTSLSKDADCPWSDLLQHYGAKDAKGGKPDDITVLLSKVTTRENLSLSTIW